MTKLLAQGDYLILEKVDYEKEEVTETKRWQKLAGIN